VNRAKRRNTAAAVDAARAVQTPLFEAEHQQSAVASQWYTPAREAKLIAEFADLPDGARVLEPAAGRGALIAAAPKWKWTAVELDERNAYSPELERLHARGIIVARFCWDFLNTTVEQLGTFDAVIMNSPYENDLDIAFVLHALRFAPKVVALLRSAFRHSSKRWKQVWRHVDVPRQAELVDRPRCGQGISGSTPMSDFAVFQFRRRERPRERGETTMVEVRWW
jgi:hypothetical protein